MLNELTHHQRSHKKNAINYFYDLEKQQRKYVSEISSDDKAYICSSTSTGMRGIEMKKYFSKLMRSKQRNYQNMIFLLPCMVNVTPGAFRIMSKEIHKIDSKDEVKISENASFVFSKSKPFSPFSWERRNSVGKPVYSTQLRKIKVF